MELWIIDRELWFSKMRSLSRVLIASKVLE